MNFPVRAPRIVATSILVAALSTAAPLASGGPRDEPKGAVLLAPFKKELMGALKAGLAEGPEQAIAACRLRAPEISASLSTGGIRMGRTSHQLRNPANLGPVWTQVVMQEFLEAEDWPAPRTVALEGGRQGYAEPIRVQALCLACHGKTLAPGVAAAIAQQYPQDRATGFAEGDLRGIFWVEYSLD